MLKNKIFWLFVLSLIGFVTGYFFWKIYECGYSSWCFFLFSKLGLPLFYGMGAFALVFLLLLFIPRAVSAWWKFAIWYVPLAAFAIATAGPTGAMIDLGPTVKDTALWLSGMYVVVSATIIAIVAIRRKT